MASQSLELLAGQIKGHLIAGDKAADKAAEHFQAAGLYLIEARDRIKSGADPKYKTFNAFFFSGCQLGKTRAYELIAIADGTKTVEETRQRSNDSSKVAHARTRADAKRPLNSGQTEPVATVAPDHAQEDDYAEKARAIFLERVEQSKRWAAFGIPPTHESADACRALSRAWARAAKQVADAVAYWDEHPEPEHSEAAK